MISPHDFPTYNKAAWDDENADDVDDLFTFQVLLLFSTKTLLLAIADERNKSTGASGIAADPTT